MSGYTLQKFGGIAPKIRPKALAEHMAAVAQNCRLDRSVIEPLKTVNQIESVPANTVAFFPYQAGRITTAIETDYVGSLLPNDVRERIYYSDTDYPKIRSGAAVYRLGLPVPASVITTSVTSGDESRNYVYTYVDDWGAESAPSDPSATIEVTDGNSVTLTLPSSFPAGNYNFGANARMRIYRTNTGTSGTPYQYVGELGTADAGFPNFIDSVSDADLQEALVTAEWIGPPDDDSALHPDGPLQGMIELSSGALCGWSGNTLCFSEPYVPYAWPARYRLSGSEKITAIAETSQGIVVTTTGSAWLVVGTHPDSMAKVDLAYPQACVSKRSMVDMGEYALYAAPDGLVQISGNDARLATLDYFSQQDWQAYDPATIRAFNYEGMYVAFYGAVTDGTGFIFDPRGGENAFIELTGLNVVYGRTDPNDGKATIVYEDSGTTYVGEFNEGNALLNYVWRSKEFVAPHTLGLSVARVEAEEYPVTLRIYADTGLYDEVEIHDADPVMLVSGNLSKYWQFEVAGRSAVNFFGAWDSMAEVV